MKKTLLSILTLLIISTSVNAQLPVGTIFTVGTLEYEITVAGTANSNSNREVAVKDYLDLNNLTPTIPSTTFFGTTYNVTSIGFGGFANNSLTSVTIPSSIISIGPGAFENNSLTSVTIPSSVTTIDQYAFNSNSLTSVTIPLSVTTIGQYAFNNNSLTSVIIPSSVTTIGQYTFNNNSLTSVTIPSSVTSIGGSAFSFNSLTSVSIPSSVTTIGGNAFKNNLLTSVTIPSSVVTIGQGAFIDNLTLTAVTSESTIPATLISSTFNDNSLIDLTIPAGTSATYTSAGWTGFNSVTETCTVTIPDANFKAYLVGDIAINTNGNTEIECSEASAFTGTLSVNSQNISDLTGIEAFTALTALICANNQLTSLDLSANTALTLLWAQFNSLTNLDVSNNILLENLSYGGNSIPFVDISNNTALKELYAYSNPLTSFDISNNIALELLWCYSTQITSLDISNHSSLTSLQCDNNSLTSLNVANGNNSNFVSFLAYNNPNLTCITVDDVAYSTTNWTQIDAASSFSANCNAPCTVNIPDANFKAYLVGNTAINTNGNTEIECSEASAFSGIINCNNLSIADVTGIEAFTALTYFLCADNQLTNIDVSNNTALVELSCSTNPLTGLDVSGNSSLTALYCKANTLTTLDVTNNPSLTHLECQTNLLTSLDISNNPNLNELKCTSNSLTSLDVSNNTAMTLLQSNFNMIQDLDISNNVALTFFSCNSNSLTSLNAANGNNSALYFVAGSNPNLTCIQVDDVSYSTTNWTQIDIASSFSLNCGTVGIDDVSSANGLSVYPNPVTNQLFIDLDNQEVTSIHIIDYSGRVVKSITNSNTKSIDVSDLPQGIYILKVSNKSGVLTNRFIKQ